MKNRGILKYFSGLSKDTFLLATASLFADISTEMLYPVFPIFLTQNLKVGGSVVGLIEGIAVATQNIIQGFSGWLSDKLQERKPIALVGYILAAVSKPLIGISSSWRGVLGARFLDRFGTGTRSAPRDALVVLSADKYNRGKAFGIEGVGDNLGAFLGPLLAVVLLSFFHLQIRSIFYLAVIPGLLAVFMISLVTEKRIVIQSRVKLDLSVHQFSNEYWKYLGVTALFGVGNLSSAFLILQTRNIGVSLGVTIIVYATYNLVAALVSYPLGTLSDGLGRKNVLLLSFLVFIITYIGFVSTRNVYVISGLFILYGCYQGIFRSVGKAFASDFVQESQRAGGLGLYSAVVGIAALVASIIAGQLWDRVSHQSVFVYGATFAVAGTFALILFVSQKGTKDYTGIV